MADDLRMRSSSTMLKGVSVARRHRVNPASERTAFSLLYGLRSKREPNLLAERSRCADHRREAVIYPSDRIKILNQRIPRKGLHNHEGPIRIEGSLDVRGRADRVAHVVEGVENRRKSVAVAGKILRRGRAELDIGHPLLLTMLFCRSD